MATSQENALKLLMDIFHLILKKVTDSTDAAAKLLPGEIGIDYDNAVFYVKNPDTEEIICPNSLEEITAVLSRYDLNSDKFNADLLNGFRLYKTLTELGLNTGSETIPVIISAMADKSALLCKIDETNNPEEYPTDVGGLLKIVRFDTNLVSLEFFSKNNKRWMGTYDSASETPFSGWSANSGGGGGGFGVERLNREILAEDSTVIPINIPEFSITTDILFVVKNGSAPLAKNIEYTIEKVDGVACIVKLTEGVWPAGAIFDFRALLAGEMADIGIFTPGVLTSIYDVTADDTTHIPINIEGFNADTDYIEALWVPWNQPLIKDINFTVTGDWLYIDLKDFSAKAGQKIYIKIIKKIKTSVQLTDGALLTEKSVSRAKLNDALQEELNGYKDQIINIFNELTVTISSLSSTLTIDSEISTPLDFKITAEPLLVNLLGKDGDFENDSNSDGVADGWTGVLYGSTATLSDTNVKYGSKAQKITSNAGDTNGARRVQKTVALTGGEYYALIVDVITDGTSQYKIAFNADVLGTVSNRVIIKYAPIIDENKIIYLYNYNTIGTVGWVQFDGCMLIKITSDEYNNLSEAELLTKYPYVNNMQPVSGLNIDIRGKNIFDGQLELGGFSTSGSKDTATDRIRSMNFTPIKEVQYKGSINVSYTSAYILYYDKDKTLIGLRLSWDNLDVIPPTNAAYMKFMFVGTIDINAQIQIEEGTSITAFEPCKKSEIIINNEFTKISNYADEINYIDGILEKLTKTRKTVIDGSFSWVLNAHGAGFKILHVEDFPNFKGDIGYCQKYDNSYLKLLIAGNSLTDKDQFILYESNKRLYITIAGSESGWGEAYSPTAEEMKACLYGWKMNNGTFGTVYNGSGTKTWTRWNDIDNTKAVTSCPVYAADGWSGWAILWRALLTPVKEILKTPLSGLSLFKGRNTINLTTGVVRERINPVPRMSGGTNYAANTLNSTVYPDSSFKKKAKRILAVYKNGSIDPYWEFLAATSSTYGEYIRIAREKYDKNAIYEVLYEPFPEDYNNGRVSCNIKYQKNLLGSFEKVIKTLSNIINTISNPISDALISEKVNASANISEIEKYKGDTQIVKIGSYRPGQILILEAVGYNLGLPTENAPIVAICVEDGPNYKKILKRGWLKVPVTGTPGQLIYADPITSGAITTTRPSTTGQKIQVLGYYDDVNTIYFNPTLLVIEI